MPASFANRPVSVGSIPNASLSPPRDKSLRTSPGFARFHQRKSTTTVFDWRHYLSVIQRKPAHSATAPVRRAAACLPASQQRMLRRRAADREMVRSSPWFSSTTSAVLAAVEPALRLARDETHILNVLHRLSDGKPIDPPSWSRHALTLNSEPQANVERYDALRETREARHAS